MKRRRRLRWLLYALVVLLLALAAAWTSILREVGGAFDHEPAEMESGLGDGARRLLDRAFEGVRDGRLLDYHTHLVGLGAGGSGCTVSPEMRSFWHITKRVRFDVYMGACGITDVERADQQYVTRLVEQIRHFPRPGRHLLLAFDRVYAEDGEADHARTELYVPNDYMFRVVAEHPDRFVPVISVHPYRRDALDALARGHARGARVVKWLPNAMGIDPASPKCRPYYDRMRELGMALLSHGGLESAIHGADVPAYGNPLLLRAALDRGVKVVVAHCASFGENADLDHPDRPMVPSYELFLRLMDEPRYDGLVFGEISATILYNRTPDPLVKILSNTRLHARLVNGSDYPIPAVNILVHTGRFVDAGLITEEERGWLNEIYEYNPLLFDFVVKRTLRLPGRKEGFPLAIFTRRLF